MAKQTQYQRIIQFLREHKIATYRDLMLHGGGNWPHRRLLELEARGYRFDRWLQGESPRHTVVHLVSAPK